MKSRGFALERHRCHGFGLSALKMAWVKETGLLGWWERKVKMDSTELPDGISDVDPNCPAERKILLAATVREERTGVTGLDFVRSKFVFSGASRKFLQNNTCTYNFHEFEYHHYREHMMCLTA